MVSLSKMTSRGRPQKYRVVRTDPKITHFSPRGKPGRPDEIEITMDQYEALRLADFMGFSQKEAANSMHISQQTFSRILKHARKNLATSLATGARIKIQGGFYVVTSREDSKIIPPKLKHIA